MKRLFVGGWVFASGIGVAQADYALNLRQGVTGISHELYNLHMLILGICVLIGIGVFGTMFYSIYHHRKSKGHVAAQFHENTQVEIIWTVIPTLILIGMAIPATKTMLKLDDVVDPDITIKVVGWQWKWEYEYPEQGIHFFSNLDEASNRARQLNSGIDPRSVPNYLLNVDKPLVIPTKKKIRFLLTAQDVIHSWWVPDFGWKKDTIPGYVNEAWTYIEEPGVFRGQCTELCGKDHGFMPIVVVAMEQADFDKWVEQQKAAAIAEAGAADKEWSKEELVAKGEAVYQTNCSSCHLPTGEGVPGNFPGLKGSAVVNGDINAQIDLVLNGKGMMPAFGAMLKPVDLAAVITYTRNAWGSQAGDMVQPAAIQNRLAGASSQTGAN